VGVFCLFGVRPRAFINFNCGMLRLDSGREAGYFLAGTRKSFAAGTAALLNEKCTTC